jgi:two-component system, cell cycle sensor histidine kinase DivJ
MWKGSGSGELLAGWFTQALGVLLDRLVHADARRDRRTSELHLRFIAARLLCACVALAVLPVCLVLRTVPHLFEITALVAILLLLAPALYVSRTGQLERGHHMSSVLLGASVSSLAWQSGGLQSLALPLFAIVLLDTAVSGSRRALTGAFVISLLSVGLMAALPPPAYGMTLSPAVISAALVTYALVMAWIFVNRGERDAHSQMRSQARATAALDTVGDVVLWLEASGEISFANAAAHAQLGLDRRAFAESHLFERINIGDRPAYLKALSDARHGAGQGLALIRLTSDVNRERLVRVFELSVRRVGPGAGEDAVVIGLRDVTARHAADELREVARLDAERIARSKSQFLATMSHELRTPLNAIIGFSELLTQADIIPPNDPRRDEYARIINGSGQHLLEVVNAILDMSKIENGMMTVEQERVEPSRVIASSRELLAVRAAAKSVSLVEVLSPDLPDIVTDRRALKQIMLNLMSNAVKFTPAGGDVTVTAVRDREHVEIVVSDTGCGIAEDDLGQLGAPFFQARQSYDRQHEGTGLGLSVVRGLLGLMGGTMLIESAPGAGTRVAIRLPVNGIGEGVRSEPVNIMTRIRVRRPALDALAPSPDTAEAASGNKNQRMSA